MRIENICIACASLFLLGCASSPGPKLNIVKNNTNPDIVEEKVIEPSALPKVEKKAEIIPPLIAIPQGRMHDGYIVGGLPSRENVEEAMAEGIESAMSLMSNQEPGIREIAPYAVSLGMRYIRFTIDGKKDLNEGMAWEFASTLPLLDKPGLIHSAKGERVGAIFALKAFFVDEKSAEEALAIGEAAGMGRFGAHVREQLGLPSR